MAVAVVYQPQLAHYDLGPAHPLRPERFTLAVELATQLGLIADTPAENPPRAALVAPVPTPEADLLLVHDAALVSAVKTAGADPAGWSGGHGVGDGDTPAFRGMHEAALAVCSATSTALDLVLDGRYLRTFAPAGGLHHAHRARCAGFCVYNDPAVAIARATRDHEGLRVAYVDIDAHHGDGVQEAFAACEDVLTVSIHESGRFLYPGTGFVVETGEGDGVGFELNLPMPPGAGNECYRLAFDEVIAPAVAAFRPDVIVAQLGADGHRNDPLTNLGLSVAGHESLVRRIVSLADELCGGKLAATGGGGYDALSAVPRCWACALGQLLGAELAEDLPAEWVRHIAQLGAVPVPHRLHEERIPDADSRERMVLLAETERVIARAREVSPLLR